MRAQDSFIRARHPVSLALFTALLACYALAGLACLDLRPLWLDEVIQLIVTTSPTFLADFLRSMGGPNPGAAPLGYLTQRPFVIAFGASPFWARFPSLVFSILSCFVLPRVCRELKIPQVSALAAGLFMVLPLQFRYATEARPYSEALCFSLLAVLAFLKLMARPSLLRACLCILAMVATVYTQPYAILSVAGVVVWAALSEAKAGDWKRAALGAIALLITLLAYLPWYLQERPQWASGIHERYPPFHWTFGLIEDVLKGLSGDGFFCSAALIFLAVAAFLSRVQALPRGLLLSAMLFPVVGALAGDAFMNYFFAARQILFGVPGLAILAACGVFELYRTNKVVALAAIAILLGAAFQKNISMQKDAKEDWRVAAIAVAGSVRNGRCLEVVPANSLAYYEFFTPGLAAKVCSATSQAPGVALVSHPYTPAAELTAAEIHLREQGFVAEGTIAIGGTRITLEQRH